MFLLHDPERGGLTGCGMSECSSHWEHEVVKVLHTRLLKECFPLA